MRHPFQFTFQQWSEWWMTTIADRARSRRQSQMGRKGNSGLYPDNVECHERRETEVAVSQAFVPLT